MTDNGGCVSIFLICHFQRQLKGSGHNAVGKCLMYTAVFCVFIFSFLRTKEDKFSFPLWVQINFITPLEMGVSVFIMRFSLYQQCVCLEVTKVGRHKDFDNERSYQSQ